MGQHCHLVAIWRHCICAPAPKVFSQIVQQIPLQHAGNLQKFLLEVFLRHVPLKLNELCLMDLLEPKKSHGIVMFSS